MAAKKKTPELINTEIGKVKEGKDGPPCSP